MRSLLACLALSLTSFAALAQSQPLQLPAAPEAAVLDSVLVQGTQPGPRMWRVTRGDHTLWILGTLRPLPRDMAWAAQEVDAIIARSGEVIAPGGAHAKLGVGGMFKVATLMPAAMKSIKNPGGAELDKVLPADLYARWLPLKQRYLGKTGKYDDYRPAMASIQLYSAAVHHAGLTGADFVGTTIAASAKRHGVKITDTGFEFPIDLDRKQLKAGIKTFAQPRPELECFKQSLDQLEPDVAAMKVRANAWAKGDLDILRSLRTEDLEPPCQKGEQEAAAFMQLPDIKRRVETAWLDAARAALERNQDSFASQSMDELLKPGGYLARLRSMGYVVHEPDEPEPEDADD